MLDLIASGSATSNLARSATKIPEHDRAAAEGRAREAPARLLPAIRDPRWMSVTRSGPMSPAFPRLDFEASTTMPGRRRKPRCSIVSPAFARRSIDRRLKRSFSAIIRSASLQRRGDRVQRDDMLEIAAPAQPLEELLDNDEGRDRPVALSASRRPGSWHEQPNRLPVRPKSSLDDNQKALTAAKVRAERHCERSCRRGWRCDGSPSGGKSMPRPASGRDLAPTLVDDLEDVARVK